MKNIFIIFSSIILGFTIGLTYSNMQLGNEIVLDTKRDLTEDELENFFRNHTVINNHAVAMKLDFEFPIGGTAYLGTIHGYSDNLSVCEELLAPYNSGEVEVMKGNFYYCEVLK